MAKQNKKSKNASKVSKEKVFLLSVIVLIIAALAIITIRFTVPQIVNQSRKHRIETVYNQINVGSDYIVQSSDIFGEKRKYDWDTSRTYSSSIHYIRGANVDTTVSDLQKHIEAAGFALIDHPYPFQWQYKSKDNVYVRFDAESKPRMDYFQNLQLMNKPVGAYDDTNTGPTNVTLKVNLDDNNE